MTLLPAGDNVCFAIKVVKTIVKTIVKTKLNLSFLGLV